MVTSLKLKLTSGILLLPILMQSFPGAALGYDVLGRLRNFVSSQVKTSDGIINPNKQKIKESFQKGADWYEGKWLGGLSLLESKTGLNEQNKVYHALKSYNLFSLGFNAGVVNGAGSLAAETYSLVAKLPTAPERLINFGLKYADDPEKYQAMVSDGARLVAGVAMNALPLLEQGKNAYLDAAQDPLKFGHLNGEGAAFVGSFLIGGGQVKALSSANKVQKAAEIAPVASLNKAEKMAGVGKSFSLGVKAPMISSPLNSLINGFKTLVANQKATTLLAPGLANTRLKNSELINLQANSKKGIGIIKGTGKTNPLENIKYTEKVKAQMKQGDYHSFPESIDGFGANGKVTKFTGGDKIVRTKIEIPGRFEGKEGIFEYIIEPDGVTCNHRLFKPNNIVKEGVNYEF